ncbi:pro-Pol polyprotein [Trichonephila inaurata madagascariensis]|uniref:Pro-Pol polyprotein n=1 Tax=Trichonephila inaurata madagascariensis TaxID=2747483 RepID=A0A8X6XKY0_9ARAC|nr:pro-Pol polyprotein [Trichonephila inaurata madagascariensis]
MGKVPGLKRKDTSAHLVTSLLIKKNSSIADLWEMEILGIMDPAETKSKEEMKKNAEEHFMKTLDRDEKGRYIVKLSWIEAKKIVQDNRAVVEQRYFRTSQQLKVEEWRKLEIFLQEKLGNLPETCNLADLSSRGCPVQGFLKSRWWEGPQWLKLPEEDWPVTASQCNLEEILKERKKSIVLSVNSVNLDKKWYLYKFSKYTQIVRLLPWMLRFVENCQHPDKRVTSHLTVSELDAAEKVLVKIVQQETLRKMKR